MENFANSWINAFAIFIYCPYLMQNGLYQRGMVLRIFSAITERPVPPFTNED